jgi:internalin A
MESNLEKAESRIEEAGRTGAKRLDLGDLKLRELPASLGGLSQLEELYLGRHEPIEGGEPQYRLFRDNPDLSDITTLAALQGLHVLDLSSTGVTDLEPIAGLKDLQSLNLSFTHVTNLEPLNGLQALQILELCRCDDLTDLNPLSTLYALQSLNLLNCKSIKDLKPLAELRDLHTLDLSFDSVTDLWPLAQLHTLRILYLPVCKGVTDLQPLAQLRALQYLNLPNCQGVTDLQPLSGLQALRHLDLSDCENLKELDPITSLRELQELDLYACRPAIPLAIVQRLVALSSLTDLKASEALCVPREVLSHNLLDNCLPRLRSYFSELAAENESENEVKMILLGNGHVGKTQLCRRFRGEPYDASVPSTHGVQIWREELKIQAAGQETAFQVNWWDFGGQDIYHGTHALFLRNRAVFVILWNPAFEDRKEFSENGLILRNQPLAYWLDYVRSLAGEGSPVVVVQSQCDTFAERQPAPSKPDGFDFFESCSFSAQTDLGRETLEGHLRDAMRYLLERNGALEIGHGRAEVRRRLYAWRSEDQQRSPAERNHRTLTLDEFRTLCDEVGGIVSWEHALDYFHQTGVVFYKPDLFSERIILDQDWALEAVYTVFHRGRAVPWLRDSGRFTREDLAATVWQDHSLAEQRLFLGLMENCGVCFRCGKTVEGESRYVAPDLLPKFDAVAGRLYAWKEDASTPTLRLEYRFFHQAIIRGLMSRIGSQAGEVAEYWKYGVWFKDGRRDAQFLLQLEDTCTNEMPGAGTLVLKAQGHDPFGLLREIREAILQQRIGEKPEELLTLNGVTVSRSALATMIDGRALDLQKRPVLAAAYSAFFEDRREPEEGRDAVKTTQINIAPQRLTENEKPPEIFISYGWGDSTPEGLIRTEAVDGLCAALEKDGFVPIRDRDQMHNGELISAFIRRLTRADHAVAIISDKYLRSPYCMFEIYKLWQKSQAEGEDMAQRVVPIVLPEVKINGAVERAPYVKHWIGQAKTLEELIRDLGINASSKTQQEARLVREFAHHIDDILVFLNDDLMPRQLEVHLDSDFQAVREALRRRLAKKDS